MHYFLILFSYMLYMEQMAPGKLQEATCTEDCLATKSVS